MKNITLLLLLSIVMCILVACDSGDSDEISGDAGDTDTSFELTQTFEYTTSSSDGEITVDYTFQHPEGWVIESNSVRPTILYVLREAETLASPDLPSEGNVGIVISPPTDDDRSPMDYVNEVISNLFEIVDGDTLEADQGFVEVVQIGELDAVRVTIFDLVGADNELDRLLYVIQVEDGVLIEISAYSRVETDDELLQVADTVIQSFRVGSVSQ